MTCVHQLVTLSTYGRNGREIVVSRCDVHGRCVPTTAERESIRVDSIRACDTCQDFRSADYLTCQLRGNDTGERINCSCGVDRTIYECAVKGQCVKRLPTGWSIDKLHEMNPGVSVCRGCGSAE